MGGFALRRPGSFGGPSAEGIKSEKANGGNTR
jgi:hypothetical protein